MPYSWAMQQSWQSDGYMGWNPYTHNGTSLPENTMLSPGDWHHWLFGFLPFWTAWDAGIWMQFFIAGLGMILLLKSEDSRSVRIAGSREFQFLFPVYYVDI
ncbi:MAG: hypothetical protein ACLT38_09485 [Akkermansia sp.]